MKIPTISVIMPVFNGSLYIAKQLESIINQLEDADELIIVEDHSTDDTPIIIKNFIEPRVRIIYNKSNCGVIESIDIGLRSAKNDIIFLSDQDDIWLPYKRRVILDNFICNENPILVITDLTLIDEKEKIIEKSFFMSRKRYKKGWFNIFGINPFIGCSMAFRKELVKYVVPIPSMAPMHDIWIGIMAQMKGNIKVADTSTMLYRRHSSNQTGRIKQSTLKKIYDRICIFALITFSIWRKCSR